MDDRSGGHHFARPRHNAGHPADWEADSPFANSYSCPFDSHSPSAEPVDDGKPGKIDPPGNEKTGYNFPEHEDTSAIGNMLVAMLDRFARRCSDAEIQLGRMRLQNAAQSAEMQVLRGRVEKLEALLPPTPRLATPPYHERDPRALPSTLQLQGPHYSDALAEAATVEVGRAVRMKAGERPRAMWTACKTEGVPHVRSELDRAGTERTYAHENAPATPRLRRPPSPKPPPTKSARFSPIDAPPVPTRSITSPHNLYNRNVRRDGRTSFEPREDGVHLEMRTHGPQAVTS